MIDGILNLAHRPRGTGQLFLGQLGKLIEVEPRVSDNQVKYLVVCVVDLYNPLTMSNTSEYSQTSRDS